MGEEAELWQEGRGSGQQCIRYRRCRRPSLPSPPSMEAADSPPPNPSQLPLVVCDLCAVAPLRSAPLPSSSSSLTYPGPRWPPSMVTGRRGRCCTRDSAGSHHHFLSFSLVVVATTTMLLPMAAAVINTGNPDAKRLYDDLLSNYNKLVRPVQNTTDPLTVRIKLKLSQLIEVVSSYLSCDSLERSTRGAGDGCVRAPPLPALAPPLPPTGDFL